MREDRRVNEGGELRLLPHHRFGLAANTRPDRVGMVRDGCFDPLRLGHFYPPAVGNVGLSSIVGERRLVPPDDGGRRTEEGGRKSWLFLCSVLRPPSSVACSPPRR